MAWRTSTQSTAGTNRTPLRDGLPRPEVSLIFHDPKGRQAQEPVEVESFPIAHITKQVRVHGIIERCGWDHALSAMDRKQSAVGQSVALSEATVMGNNSLRGLRRPLLELR